MQKIKINGVIVNVVRGSLSGAFFQVDSPENPGVPVAQHSFGLSAPFTAAHIERGGSVRTSGNVYARA
jgi:hypothetical protein